jgi:hypothetical protein
VKRGVLLFAAAAAGGAVAGWWLGTRRSLRHRHDLFSPNPFERVAALAAMMRRPGPESLTTLQDYLQWEPRPALRRRAAAYAAELEAALVSAEGGA